MLKHKDATRIGSATSPEPMMPSANKIGPIGPSGESAPAASLVVIENGSAACMREAATITESETRHATTQPTCASMSCKVFDSRFVLVCHTTTSGVSSDPNTAITAITYPPAITDLPAFKLCEAAGGAPAARRAGPTHAKKKKTSKQKGGGSPPPPP